LTTKPPLTSKRKRKQKAEIARWRMHGACMAPSHGPAPVSQFHD
jgi:hypothetical protein